MSTRGLVAGTVAVVMAGSAVLVWRNRPREASDRSVEVRVSGTVVVERLRGGEVERRDSIVRTLTGSGIRLLIGQLVGDSSAPFDTGSYIAIGNDTTPSDSGQTSLLGTTVTWGNVDSLTYAANYVKWFRTFLSDEANHYWGEVGLFNDSGGTMLDRGVKRWGTKTTADTWRVVVVKRFY